MRLECEKIVVGLDEEVSSEKKHFCTQCGEAVLEGSACKTPSYLVFCDFCRPIKRLKDTWKPLNSGTVSRIFRVA